MNKIEVAGGQVVCTCGAADRIGSNTINRFLRRHPKLCTERKEFAKQLAAGTRSVDADKERIADELALNSGFISVEEFKKNEHERAKAKTGIITRISFLPAGRNN